MAYCSAFYADWLWASVVGLLHALLVSFVDSRVPEPYMDEIFHTRQTRTFCAGNFSYDAKITTPPALYVLALPFCGRERLFNSLLLPFSLIGFLRFRRLWSTADAWPVSVCALFLPVLLHSSLLFYTDLLSVTTVVWGFVLSPLPSSLVFALSLLTRQTNIVWAGVYALLHLARHFDPRRPLGLFREVLVLSPFLLLLFSFIGFVYKNGSIVLGDASAHKPVPHFSQLLYFFTFSLAHCWPLVLPRFSSFSRSLFSIRFVLLSVLFAMVVYFFSFSHLYLISDNRHVPFYLWRWWLGRGLVHRVSLCPLYAASCLFFFSNGQSRLFSLLLFLASAAVLVPAHLLEPRYFITPFILWRLSYRNRAPRLYLVLEFLSNLCVFSVVFYLFLFKPFEWSNEPGQIQRFMW